jgi:predicted adenylyl cyclase CyaB
MAYDGIEVEIKMRTDKATAEAIKKKLLSAPNVESTHHTDTYFDSKEHSFLNKNPIEEWLRIGKRGEKIFINHKLWHYDKNNISTHCDEVELVVGDLVEGTKLLSTLGFESLITVDKQRVEALLSKNYLVSVDEIMDLGYFVEIELNESVGNIKAAREALHTFATELGLDPKDVLQKGYPHLLLEHRLGRELSQ